MVANKKSILALLEQVKDPEIPVLSVMDLGIVRAINIDVNQVEVVITPTYLGCPAIHAIEESIKDVLNAAGHACVVVTTVMAPAWTTDWLTDGGRKKLEAYGIAPPVSRSVNKEKLTGAESKIRCPQCKSYNTIMVSQFGSTACKAHYKCKDCLEPFDYFKCL